MSLIIHAPNVHQGGGLTLLLGILKELKNYHEFKIIVDERFVVPDCINENHILLRVKPTILGRLYADLKLRSTAKANSVVLCFGNLPPLFRLNAYVCLFMQNMYLVSGTSLNGFSISARLRISLERIWLKLRINYVNEIIVQSESMQVNVLKNLKLPSQVFPFTESINDSTFPRSVSSQHQTSKSDSKDYDFLYVASGEPHKNHLALIEAWKILASKNIFPSLCLTISLDSNPELYKSIEYEKEIHDLKIECIGFVSSKKMPDLYQRSGALIYPSTMESLGLPLIEARHMGLPIIASERDYVRDIIDPEQSFDPLSPVSIARAVERFLNYNQLSTTIVGPDAFVKYLLDKIRA